MTTVPELNERQRTYLLAALEIDQHQEVMHKRAFQRGNFDESRRPASEWRAMAFGVVYGPGGPLPTMLRTECKQVDEGSGSTWAALERRGYLTVREAEVQYYPGQRLPHIILTSKGRRAARELKGEKLPAKPKSALARSTWKALAAGWKAGEHGLWDERGGDWFGGISWDTWLMLVRGTKHRGPWFDEISRSMPDEHKQHIFALTGQQHGVKINVEGMRKYLQTWEVNHQLHPDIDAPNPWQVQEAQS